MPPHLIIDGYNLIGHDGGLRGNLEARRNTLISRLEIYHRQRRHRVTVVFDGWRAGWSTEHEELVGHVHVIYSREGVEADEVIARLAKAGGAAIVVVSSDRAVQAAVRAAGGVALSCGEFERKLSEASVAQASGGRDLQVDEDDRESMADWPRRTDKKGNPYRRSKVERRKASKLKKL